MDFDLALACVDPTTRRGETIAWTPARAACKLCGDDGSDAPCCGATLCARCIVTSAAAGATGELRCPSCNSDGDYYVAYAATYGAQRPVRAPQVSEDDEVVRLRQELADRGIETCVVLDDATDAAEPCAICLEPLGDAPRMPGCAHRFHAACVLGPGSLAAHAWADGVMPSTRRGQRVLCPLCRAPSLIPPGFL